MDTDTFYAVLAAIVAVVGAFLALGYWAFRGLPTGEEYYREIDRRRDGRHDDGTTGRK